MEAKSKNKNSLQKPLSKQIGNKSVECKPEAVSGAGAGLPVFMMRSSMEHPESLAPEGSDAFLQAPAELGSVPADRDPLEHEADRVADHVVREADNTQPPVSAATLRSPPEHLGDELASAQGGGLPLQPRERAFFESRLKAPLGDVRIHANTRSEALTRSIHARAFTVGSDIHFGAGRFDPDTEKGRRLMAHELTHVLQQRRGGTRLQANLDTDFANEPQEIVAEGNQRPLNHIKVQNSRGVEVYAPYRIYELSRITEQYDHLNMGVRDAAAAVQIRYPNLGLIEALNQGSPPSQLSIADFRHFASVRSGARVRVLIARYEGGVHLVGFDSSVFTQSAQPSVGSGFVMGAPEARGTGRILLIDRVIGSIRSGAELMHVTVGYSAETLAFHQNLHRAAQLASEDVPYPSEQGEHYSLSLRAMVRLLTQWGRDRLDGQQRGDLRNILRAQGAIDILEVQSILNRSTTGGGDGGSGGPGSGSGMRGAISRLLGRIGGRSALSLNSHAQLRDPETVSRVLTLYAGLVVIQGILYQLSEQQGRLRTRELTPARVAVSLPSPGTGGGLPGRPVLRPFSGRTGGGFTQGQLPRASSGSLRVGDYIIVGGQAEAVVTDVRTGRAVATWFSGGQWYRVTTPSGSNMIIDAETQRIVPPTMLSVEGRRVPVEPAFFEPASSARTTMGRMRRGPARAVGVGGGLLVVANEIMAPIGATYEVQRSTIRRGQAEIDFWTRLGADPEWAVWDATERGPLPWSTAPRTGVFVDTHRYPYVVNIDTEKLARRLPERIRDYQEFALFLDLGRTLGAIREEGGRFYAITDMPAHPNQRVQDITAIVERVRTQSTLRSDQSMRRELAALPEDQLGNVFRLRSGRNARLWRSAQGGQPIRSAGMFLGPQPWVRVLGRRVGGGVWNWFRYGNYQQRILVAPANGDALRAALNSVYLIHEEIDDVLEEVRNGGRPILSRSEQHGRLNGFVAGPDSGASPRFGTTRYQRHPQHPNIWTVAIGELKQFWVDASELTDTEVGASAVRRYMRGPQGE